MKPLYDRIVVQPSESEEKTKGGLYIPPSAKERPMQGVVVAVGPGKRNNDGTLSPLYLRIGDEVLFGKYAGTDVVMNDEPRKILKEEDVLVLMSRKGEDTGTSADVAEIAGRVLTNPGSASTDDILSLAGSALSQKD